MATPGLRILLLCCVLWLNGEWISAQSPGNTAACNVQVNAGPDITLCEPGGHIVLDGSVSSNVQAFEWSPPTGLNSTTILNPQAVITDPIVYTLTGWGIDPTYQNLVYNGNFSLGNTGFNTDYNYVMDMPGVQNEMYVDGTYTVIHDPSLVNDNWDPCPSPVSGGNMLLINGVAPLDTFWCQTIPVEPNTQYHFSGWVLELAPTILDLYFSFNGATTPVIWYGTTVCNWLNLSYPPYTNWYSGDTTSVEICVICANFGGGGGYPLELAFDDFSLVEMCSVSDSVSIFLTDDVAPVPEIIGATEVCRGDFTTYSVEFPTGTEVISYAWSISPNGFLVSGQGTNQITVQWNSTGTGSVCLSYSTFCHSNNGCSIISVIDEPPDFQISGPAFLCSDQVGTYTVPISPENEYQWHVPPEIDILNGENTHSLQIQLGNAVQATICVDISNSCGITSDCIDISESPGYETYLDITLCEGEVMVINGTEYGEEMLFGTEHFTSSDGCDSIVDIQITIEPLVMHHDSIVLCSGDSVYLQGAFQTFPGTYTDTYTVQVGCDSLVHTYVSISFPDTTWLSSTTCDSALAGTVVSTYPREGCDSIVVEYVTWIPGDSTFITLASCNPSDTGQTVEVLQGIYGCDSLIITYVFFEPLDSTFIEETSCDSSSLGVFIHHLNSAGGCDSTVIQTVAYSAQDSTFVNGSSCNSADVGVSVQMLTNGFGCDSIVTTTISLLPSDEIFISSATCDPDEAGNFDFIFVNQFGCDSIIHETISLLPGHEIFISSSSCNLADTGTFVNIFQNQFGCDSLVRLHVEYKLADTTQLISNTCDPSQVGTIENMFTNQFGCDSLVIEITKLFSLPQLELQLLHEYNGYGVSCYGATDGGVMALAEGEDPFQYLWSVPGNDVMINDLPAGFYSLTVTDANECQTKGSIELIQPEEFRIGLEVDHPDCFDMSAGSIVVVPVGGVEPTSYSIDGIQFQSSPLFDGLNSGAYTLTAKDANDCDVQEIIWLNVPLAVNVDLGVDQVILPGETTVIEAIVDIPFDSLINITWTGMENVECPTCLVQAVAPIITTAYSISVTNAQGCSDSDTMVVVIETVTDGVYVPNVFSPNGDHINDVFLVKAGSQVEEIESMQIFDRWGNLVFAASHFLPNDEQYGWRGEGFGPGVFAYRYVIKLKDGKVVVRNGDVTLMK